MKVRFYCDSGANIHSNNQRVFTLTELGITDDEWAEMSENDKYKEAEQWAWDNGLEIGFEEIEEGG